MLTFYICNKFKMFDKFFFRHPFRKDFFSICEIIFCSAAMLSV